MSRIRIGKFLLFFRTVIRRETDGHLTRKPRSPSGSRQDGASQEEHENPRTGARAMKKTVLIAAILLGSLGAGVAMADDDECYVPMTNWQSRDAVQKMAEGRGWTVRRIKTEDGCYEIKGRDENGREI